MTLSSIGFPGWGFHVIPGSTKDSNETGDEVLDRLGDARQPSRDIADNLSPVAKKLLKRMAQLQEQLRDLRSSLRAAENAAHSNLEAKNAVVASYQGQISAVSGAVLLMSAALFKELDRSTGLDITA